MMTKWIWRLKPFKKPAHTGKIGDGKIFVMPVEQVIQFALANKGKRLFKPYAQLTRRLEVISGDGVEQCWQQLQARLLPHAACLYISTHRLFPQAEFPRKNFKRY